MVPNGYYAVLYKLPGGEGVGVRFAEHPNIITYGRDWTHAAEMAREALAAGLETDYELGFKLPPAKRPRAAKGERVVFVVLEPDVRVAYMLRAVREQAGLTQKEVAARLGITYQSYQRMERPGRSNLSLATLSRVAHVLEKDLVVDLK